MQYYVHSDLASGGGQYSAAAWSEVQQMAMEVAELAPALSAGCNRTGCLTLLAESLAAGPARPVRVLHAAWEGSQPTEGEGGGTLLVLVANADNVPASLSMHVDCALIDCRPSSDGAASASVLFQQGRTTNISTSGDLTDILLGLGTATRRLWTPARYGQLQSAHQPNAACRQPQ